MRFLLNWQEQVTRVIDKNFKSPEKHSKFKFLYSIKMSEQKGSPEARDVPSTVCSCSCRATSRHCSRPGRRAQPRPRTPAALCGIYTGWGRPPPPPPRTGDGTPWFWCWAASWAPAGAAATSCRPRPTGPSPSDAGCFSSPPSWSRCGVSARSRAPSPNHGSSQMQKRHIFKKLNQLIKNWMGDLGC